MIIGGPLVEATVSLPRGVLEALEVKDDQEMMMEGEATPTGSRKAKITVAPSFPLRTPRPNQYAPIGRRLK